MKAGGFARNSGANGISPTNGKGKKRSLNSAGSSGVGKVNTDREENYQVKQGIITSVKTYSTGSIPVWKILTPAKA